MIFIKINTDVLKISKISNLLFSTNTKILAVKKASFKWNLRVVDLFPYFRKYITKSKKRRGAIKRLSVIPLSEAALLENVIPETISSTVLTTSWRFQDALRDPAAVTLTCVIRH